MTPTTPASLATPAARDRLQVQLSSLFLAKVFNWMGLGLGVTAVVALLTHRTGLAYRLVASPLFLVLLLAELGLVFFLSSRVQRMRAATGSLLFLVYAVLNGVTLSTIFLVYTTASITQTFFIAAAMFCVAGGYGLVTKRRLDGLGGFLFMGLVGIVIASVVNLFFRNPAVYWALSLVGVFVFLGLAAYDVQKIKQMGESGLMEAGEEAIGRMSVLGALALYLDFINLFLMLLRFFGSSRD